MIQPYKVSTWDSIPDDAKDPDGYWYGDYYGVMAFLVNTDVQPDVPQDWADLLDPKYKGQIALSGDPRTSNQAIQAVYAASLANGGSLDNIQPGLDFFAQLNTAGNLIPLIANNGLVAKGEIPVRITWDYNALAAVELLRGQPAADSRRSLPPVVSPVCTFRPSAPMLRTRTPPSCGWNSSTRMKDRSFGWRATATRSASRTCAPAVLSPPNCWPSFRMFPVRSSQPWLS